jgi:hypothetical protein
MTTMPMMKFSSYKNMMIFFFFFLGGAQWEKSNKFVPLGKMKKIFFEN